MTSLFSWADTLHIAVNNCLPCLHRVPSNDSQNNSQPTSHQHIRPDELRGLLNDQGSTSSIDETLSLHSNIGFGNRRKKKRASAKPQKYITLFGYNLFGHSPSQPIHLSDDDDALYHDAPPPVEPTLTGHSSASFDLDAAPLDAATIDNLPASATAVLAELEERENIQKEERRRKRQEKKQAKKMAQTLLLAGEGKFEGFQGSGDGCPATPSHLDDRQLRVAGSHSKFQRPPSPSLFLPNLIKEEDDDDGADLDGDVYIQRTPGGNSSGGSGSRSRTSNSTSDRLSTAGFQPSFTSQPLPEIGPNSMLSSPTSTRIRKSKRVSDYRSKSTNSSNSTHMGADSASLASPASSSFPEDQNGIHPNLVTIVSPSTTEQGQGFFDLEETQVRIPVAQPAKSHEDTTISFGRGAFPSVGLSLGSGFPGRARGAFLADTSGQR